MGCNLYLAKLLTFYFQSAVYGDLYLIRCFVRL